MQWWSTGINPSILASGTAPIYVQLDNGYFDEVNHGVPFNPGASNLTSSTYNIVAIYASDGCDRSSGFAFPTATITVNNLTPGSIAADQTICEGDDVVAFTSTTMPAVMERSLTSGSPALPVQ